MSRTFDYIRYDEESINQQELCKLLCKQLEENIQSLGPGRAQALAITKLEECYAWIGKAIRDNQYYRDSKAPDVPERGE